MRVVNTAGIILAAGFSRRLGRPKQEVVLGGRTLLERAVATAMAAALDPVVAVVRDPQRYSRLSGQHILLMENTVADEGMGASVRLGVEAALLAGARGAVLMTCDQPLLCPQHLEALCARPERVTASAYGGRKGVPAYFPSSHFAQLLALQGDQGARALLREAEAIPDEDLALDVDTETDLQRAEALMTERKIND